MYSQQLVKKRASEIMRELECREVEGVRQLARRLQIAPNIEEYLDILAEGRFAVILSQNGFTNIETMEVIIRDIEAREGMTRPSMRMIGHTAYLTFATKIL